LAGVESSINLLSNKVDQQYTNLASTVATLTATIECQNAVIAKIQHKFKSNMEALTSKPTFPLLIPHAVTPTAATSSLWLHNLAG
jgi:hypothetical protein